MQPTGARFGSDPGRSTRRDPRLDPHILDPHVGLASKLGAFGRIPTRPIPTGWNRQQSYRRRPRVHLMAEKVCGILKPSTRLPNKALII